MTYQPITCAEDDLLVVYIDREQSSAGVFYRYDDGEEQSTMFHTADMPMDDQAAARLVNEWLA